MKNKFNKEKENLIEELKEQVKNIKKLKTDLANNLNDENNMTTNDLRYMNAKVEIMMLEHEKLLKKYFKVKDKGG
tara:strand:+ start:311 stop:535 length:225 start_codon:yes stop_codon:yes gene_type:complete